MKLKRITALFLSLSLILNTILPTFAHNNTVRANSFTADFTAASTQWEGDLTSQLGYTPVYKKDVGATTYGNADGWNNAKGSISTKDTYDFGEKFDAEFSLYTRYRNGNKNGTTEDLYVSIGKLKIAICDFQTRIEVYYDGTKLSGTNEAKADITYPSDKIRDYTYAVHVENGNITIESDLIKHTATIDNFVAVNDAKIEVTINETSAIHEEFFGSLIVTGVQIPETEGRKTSFTADFAATSIQWEGDLTSQLGYTPVYKQGIGATTYGNADGWNNAKGSISTKDTYDFGEKFDAEFSLYTRYRNGNKNGTTEDFYVSIGKLKIAICDFQTRIEVYYDGTKLTGTNEAKADITYPSDKVRDYTYAVHVENGNVTIESDLIKYTATIDNFADINDAKVEVTINETSAIHEEFFSSLNIQTENDSDDMGSDDSGSDDTGSNEKRESSFVTDFKTTEGWAGDTFEINTEKGQFQSSDNPQRKPGITTIASYDFGDKFDASFSVFYNIANGALKVNGEHVANPKTGVDLIITIGKFTIQIKNYQTEITVLYDGIDIGGTNKCNVTRYKTAFTYEYDVHIEKGKISIKSIDATTKDMAVYFTSDFSDFEVVNNAQVGIKWNESWQLQGTPHIKNLKIQVVDDSDDAGSGKKRESSFVTDFKTTEGWAGDTFEINTEKGQFQSSDNPQQKPGITTIASYDFGEKFDASFSVFYNIANGVLKVNGEHIANPKTGIDLIITIGKFTIQIKNYQTEITVLYDGMDIGGTSKSNVTSYKTAFTYEYDVHIEKGKISIIASDTSTFDAWLEYTSNFTEFDKVNNAKIGIKWNESWQLQGTPHIKKIGVQAMSDNADINTGEKRAAGFATTFKTKDEWSGDVDYIFTDKRGFGSIMSGNEPIATITTVDKYDFGKKFDASFELSYGAANNGYYESKKLAKPYPTGCDYVIKIGDFVIQIWNYQSEIKVLYKGKDIGGTSKCYDKAYAGGTRSYKVHIEQGKITITSQDEFEELKVKYTSQFSGFDAVNNASITLVRRESWQIVASRIMKLRVGTPPSNTSNKSLYRFNAQDDFKKIIESEDSATALIKSQWNIWQKTSEFNWTTDEIKEKNHITGFQTAIPTEPSAIPVVQALTSGVASEVGVYLNAILLRTSPTSAQRRTTALSFEAPATGQIRLYDPEEGMISIASSLNKQATWCMNSDPKTVKSCYIAIYKNNEKIWPQGKGEFLFANSTHKDVTSAVTETDFPDLLIDVEQGDMIYITVRPEHRVAASGAISPQNPTAITMNPQIDYIRIDGEMKLNTDRELAKEEIISVASRIKTKSAAIRALEFPTETNRNLIYALGATGVFIIFMFGITVYVVKRRRKTTV